MEEFSLNLLCPHQDYRLSETLESLKPQKKNFEVVIIGDVKEDLLRQFPELKIRIIRSFKTKPEMMNEGLKASVGKYVQFLEPGDRYISHQALEYLEKNITGAPDLIYANTLVGGSVANATQISAHFPWFLKTKLLEIGGFDRRFPHFPIMDLLCRAKREGAKTFFCPRVLLGTPEKQEAQRFEIFRVYARYFGVNHALKRLIFHDRKFFSKLRAFLKKAFWRADY